MTADPGCRHDGRAPRCYLTRCIQPGLKKSNAYAIYRKHQELLWKIMVNPHARY
jgi:hypothetical protein